MKIISNFKDYYDNVGHIYGADPKIVYVRQEFAEYQLESLEIPEPPNLHFPNWFIYHDTSTSTRVRGFDKFWLLNQAVAEYYPHYLCICGKLYLLLSNKIETVFYNNIEKAVELVEFRYNHDWEKPYKDGTEPFPALIEICKKLKAPVFQFSIRRDNETHNDYLFINQRVPKLSELKLAKYYPAEQLYQDISYFMGNTINPSPDLQPPVVIPNDQRIVQFGFDLKTSFRGKIPKN